MTDGTQLDECRKELLSLSGRMKPMEGDPLRISPSSSESLRLQMAGARALEHMAQASITRYGPTKHRNGRFGYS